MADTMSRITSAGVLFIPSIGFIATTVPHVGAVVKWSRRRGLEPRVSGPHKGPVVLLSGVLQEEC